MCFIFCPHLNQSYFTSHDSHFSEYCTRHANLLSFFGKKSTVIQISGSDLSCQVSCNIWFLFHSFWLLGWDEIIWFWPVTIFINIFLKITVLKLLIWNFQHSKLITVPFRFCSQFLWKQTSHFQNKVKFAYSYQKID